MQEDTYRGEPNDPLSLNLYTYCVNNPLVYYDPSGHEVITLLALWAGAIAASPDTQLDMQFMALSISEGDYFGAVLDALGLLIPGITGLGQGSKSVKKFLPEIGEGINKALEWTKGLLPKADNVINNVVEWTKDLLPKADNVINNVVEWTKGLLPKADNALNNAVKWTKGLFSKSDDIVRNVNKFDEVPEMLNKLDDGAVKSFDDIEKIIDDFYDFADDTKKIANDTAKGPLKRVLQNADNAKHIDEGLEGASEVVFKTGKEGEEYLAKLVGGKPQQYFKTTHGGRYIDQLADGIAYESKVGYRSLDLFTNKQVLKDMELLNDGIVDAVEWHFFRSGNTGKIGPSKTLIEMLIENGIKVVTHN